MFKDRDEAGERLAAVLGRYKGRDVVVLALPRGGVPIAAAVAEALDAPLDLVIARKIGVPFQPELAMGAVVDGAAPLTVKNADVIALTGIDEETFDRVRDAELDEIKRRRARYVGERPHSTIAGRTVIVIDDGIATGATFKAALRAVRKQSPATLVLAVPVAPPSTLREMAEEADDIVCLESPEYFGSIGEFYLDFGQVPDAEVTAILARFPVDAEPEAKGGR